ncbi:hypothetical protein PoB_004575800 [Plakobranchus ocellatus]|uniref:Mitochondrial splicing suppressor 51-like C-terminal domain-containing protein n=1 Tax=Plakobranchus ocellatus TaxID=259542 RepID=A0AAV4BI24_9GAST|nr:hypothetical protein PoB_004575800 [Plakobranchus ocellatus]
MRTIKQILAKGIPLFVTDYCYEAVAHTKKTLQEFKLGIVREAKCNPFHSPFRLPAPELEHPCFSNGIVFSVQNYT